MIGFVVALVLFSGVVYWLYRAKQADVAACAAALGLANASEKIVRRGHTAEGLAFFEQLRARGEAAGCGAEVWERQIKRAVDQKYRQSRGSTLTVLEIKPSRPAPHSFRIQPVGVMGVIEKLTQGTPESVATGDAAFDGAFTLYTKDAAGALAVLTPDARRDLLEFRRTVAGDVATLQAGNLAVSLMLGSFEISPDRVSVGVFGTPSRKIGEQLRRAAPLLAKLSETRKP